MKIQVLYASNHGRTKQVASHFSYSENVEICKRLHGDIIIFLCPTYGDEELPFSMENFLLNLKDKNKKYTICELGNYYGYDDFEFGAKKIIKSILNEKGWIEFYKSLSLDSIPQIDWEVFYNWKNGLDNVLRNIDK